MRSAVVHLERPAFPGRFQKRNASASLYDAGSPVSASAVDSYYLCPVAGNLKDA